MSESVATLWGAVFSMHQIPIHTAAVLAIIAKPQDVFYTAILEDYNYTEYSDFEIWNSTLRLEEAINLKLAVFSNTIYNKVIPDSPITIFPKRTCLLNLGFSCPNHYSILP